MTVHVEPEAARRWLGETTLTPQDRVALRTAARSAGEAMSVLDDLMRELFDRGVSPADIHAVTALFGLSVLHVEPEDG